MTTTEFQRYQRQLTLAGFGEAGQRRLKAARVLIVGVGGLGSPVAIYLAAAGVGTLTLVDFDLVDETNLHRQVIHTTPDIGTSKLLSAAAKISALNPYVRLELHDEPLDASNARRLIDACDLVVDGTDNFPTRYLVNDACVLAGTPNVYGSILQFEGQASVFAVPGGPCYRCLHPEPPPVGLIPSCADAGVLGVLPGLIGIVQATEAIKLITGVGEPLVGRLLLYDALKMRFREIALPPDPDCPACGAHPTIRELVSYEPICDPAGELTVEQLRDWQAHAHRHMLIDVREPSEYAICHIEGSVLIPLRQLEECLEVLPRDLPVVVHCKSGGRSARAAALLRARGYDARNLTGGILGWANRIDPTLNRY